jgi:hypothetical protein
MQLGAITKLSAPQVSGTTKTKFWVRQNSPEDETSEAAPQTGEV